MAIALLPYSGMVFIYQGMAERYAYLASMGAALAIVGLVWQVEGRKRLVVMGCFAGWFLWGAWRLNSRVREWHDEISLYSSSLKADPNSPILLYNLANAVEDAGDLRTAFLLTKRALDLRPNYERAINGIGTIYLRIGSLQNGKAAFERASALDPNDEKPISNLGTVYMRLGLLEPAKGRLERAIALDPNDVQALSNLGVIHMRLGELKAAEKNFKRVIAIAPNENIARCNLAMVIFSQGRWDEAVERLLDAARRHPSDANPYYFLGLLDEQIGAREAAIEMFKRAVQLKPDYVEAQAKLVELHGK
jgi:tetratricopeptide (TPR) repeat protein